MDEDKVERIKELISKRIKDEKGEIPYARIAERCNTSAARISDAANNKIDYRISTFIDIAIGLRIHPKELFDICFDFESFYANLDGSTKKGKIK